MIKIIPFPKQTQLTEIYQTIDLRFSFLILDKDGNYCEQNPPCKCRDYLHDIVNSNLTGKPFNIYGMEYDAKEFPIDLNVTRYLLRFPSAEKQTYFETNFKHLLEIEKKAGVAYSTFTIVNNREIILTGDKFWISNSLLISLYSYFCRCMCYKDMVLTGKDQEYDYYLSKTKHYAKALENVSVLKTKDFHGWPSDSDKIHDYSGVLTFLCPTWTNKSINTCYKELKERGVV